MNQTTILAYAYTVCLFVCLNSRFSNVAIGLETHHACRVWFGWSNHHRSVRFGLVYPEKRKTRRQISWWRRHGVFKHMIHLTNICLLGWLESNLLQSRLKGNKLQESRRRRKLHQLLRKIQLARGPQPLEVICRVSDLFLWCLCYPCISWGQKNMGSNLQICSFEQQHCPLISVH